MHLNMNRNKRSVTLDLKTAGGREALMRLVETADVFVHSMRPAAAKRLGVGYDDHLRAQSAHHLRLRPRLSPGRAAIATIPPTTTWSRARAASPR